MTISLTISKSKPLLQAVAMSLLILSSCKSTKLSTSSDTSGQSIETGVASWYGPGFQGKKTANGEKFDTNTLTAAHRTLPFGTRVRVENLTNRRSTIVRINDRGPFAKDRIIDLSKKAANQLSMIEAGTARVELFLLSASKDDLKVDNLKRPTYTIQVASFSDRERASKRARDFQDGWIKKVEVKQKVVYRVFVGKFTEISPAKKRNAELRLRGTSGFVKQIEN